MPRKSRTNPELFVHEDVVSVREAARLLNISRATWYRVYHANVPTVQVSPGRIGVRRSTINGIIQQNEWTRAHGIQ